MEQGPAWVAIQEQHRNKVGQEALEAVFRLTAPSCKMGGDGDLSRSFLLSYNIAVCHYCSFLPSIVHAALWQGFFGVSGRQRLIPAQILGIGEAKV